MRNRALNLSGNMTLIAVLRRFPDIHHTLSGETCRGLTADGFSRVDQELASH